MRASQFLLTTSRETPSDAEVISHQLMLRSGMIRKLASGLYSWLPLGLKVLRKVEHIVREEMNNAGAQELLMPVVQPAELWEESGRWNQYGPELLRIQDRHQRDFCLGPTHEEVITTIARNEMSSYKHLPQCFYQIQTKFRDEIRPRFGVMRSREFIMKDAYSFHMTDECLQNTYDAMHTAYSSIFSRIGLDFRPVLADTGSIGGSSSHEFHVLADSGEDDIAISDESDYAANVELAEALAPNESSDAEQFDREEIATPNQRSINELANYLDVSSENILKTLIVLGDRDEHDETPPLVALVIRGDHELNAVKAEKIKGIAQPIEFASDDTISKTLGVGPGSIGPLNLNIPVVVDRSAAVARNFVCGANANGIHYKNANWQAELTVADIRNVIDGDPSPCGNGRIVIRRGIEVGHIFQLGTKYSEAMNVRIQDLGGKNAIPTMGCYGIGVTRVVASAIEQNHDANGIIWPAAIAPFQLAIVPINAHKSEAVKTTCETLYSELRAAGIDVLYMDESKARLGVMLADIELIGIPHRVVIGERGLKAGTVEYRHRTMEDNENLDSTELAQTLLAKLNRQ